MPSVDIAMARSLQGSSWDMIKNMVTRSVSAELIRRNVVDDATDKVTDVATAFSSWDNCMSVAWCKWPVIGVIAIVGLIVFSILWCIIRCCLCGLSCCCSCFECLKCCGNCCGACDPPGENKRAKHLDDPYAPQNHHHQQNVGYRSESPMQTSGIQFAQKPAQSAPAQYAEYAEFETSKSRNDDALPEMPSWEGANSKKVPIHEEVVELDSLSKPAASDPRMGAMNNTPPNQLTPYSQPQANSSGYLNQGHQPQDVYSPLDQGYGYNATPSGDGYRPDQAYGASAMGVRHNGYDQQQGYGQNRGYGQPQSQGQPVQNEYGNYGDHRGGPSPAPHDYAMGQPPNARRTPAPQNDFDAYGQSRRTPAPPGEYESYSQVVNQSVASQNGYDGYGQAARQSPAPQNDYAYAQPGYGQRIQSPAPEAHYGARPVPQRQYPQERSHSPMNESNYDYNSGYSRQQQQQQQQPAHESYGGYRSYQP